MSYLDEVDGKPIQKGSERHKGLLKIPEGYGYGWTRVNYSDSSKFISVIVHLKGDEFMQFKIWKNVEKKKPTHPDWRIRVSERLTFKSSAFMDTDWLRRSESNPSGSTQTDTPNLSAISSTFPQPQNPGPTNTGSSSPT